MVQEKIDAETEQVLIGSLLGDGTLQLHKKGINANFKEIHSIKQKKYLLWKKRMLNFFNPKTSEYKTFDKRTNKYYYCIILWTRVHPILTKYKRSLYINNKKNINENILEKVGPLALAVWYCDDGSFGYINQNGKIATYLSYKKNILITKFLKEKFNINCTVNKDGNSHHLYFSVKEIKKFLKLIENYVPKCMNYKLGPLKEENINKIKEENSKRRARDKKKHIKNMKDPIKRKLINKQKREYQKIRLQNPEYRRKHNGYHKLKEREYRKKRKIRSA